MRGRTITLDMSTGWVGQSERLFQYDYGQRLIITGVELPPVYEVHFSNQERGESKTSIGDATGVDIPDEYLTTGKNIHVWLYLHDTASDGETEYHGIIAVEKRAQPTDQEPTPVQQSAIDQAIAALNAGVSEVEDIAEGIPTAIDTALQEAKDSGEFDGEDGFSPVANVEKVEHIATITITDATGTTTAQIRDGIDGASGVTDYKDLDNKPQIGGVTLAGNKTASDLGLLTNADLNGKADKTDTTLNTTLSRGRKANTTVGIGSYAFGNNVTASGNYSHAEGYSTSASNAQAHAEGDNTIASGAYAHAEGCNTMASGTSAHAEGYSTSATGEQSHAEGFDTVAYGDQSHTEGTGTVAYGGASHAEGCSTAATGYAAHAEGYNTTVTGYVAHVEGYASIASGGQAHAEGASTKASGGNAHSEGVGTVASGNQSHAEGERTTASGANAHAEGYNTTASEANAHAEGSGTQANGFSSHTEGGGTYATGNYSHAEGSGTTASGLNSHSEGGGTQAIGDQSHAEGGGTQANGLSSHAEGASTIANGAYSHVSGIFNVVDSYANWDEWVANTAYDIGDKVKRTTTSNNVTTVEGYVCETANSDATFDPSKWTQQYGKMNYVEIVGNGKNSNNKSNARTLDWDGNEELAGDLTVFKGTANETSMSATLSALSSKVSEPSSEGTNGQVLTTDGNGGRTWATPSGGGGTSDYSDLSNKPQINSVTLSGNKSLSDLGIASASDVSAKYAKPSGGIPKTDLDSAVQTSLGKADTALQGEDVATAVDAWCDENITNPDSPPLDRSLLSASSAAPADMMGTVKSTVDRELGSSGKETQTVTYTDGYSIGTASGNKGQVIESSSNSVTNKISLDGASKVCCYYSTGTNPYGSYFFYTSADAYISHTTIPSAANKEDVNVPENADYVRYFCMTSKKSNIVLEFTKNIEGAVYAAINAKLDTDQGIANAGKLLFVGDDGNVSLKSEMVSESGYSGICPLFVSMMPDFFWVSQNEIAAFSASLPKYKDGTEASENNAWFKIRGNEGDSFVTVISGGNGDVSDITAAEKEKPFGCVIMYDDGRYYPCNAQYLTDTTFSVYPPLKENITAGELAQIRTGIHLSRRGYRAYSQFLYGREPKHCEKNKYIARWRVEDESEPFTFYGYSTYYHNKSNKNMSTDIVDRLRNGNIYNISKGTAESQPISTTETGIEWEVPINGLTGYVEVYLAAHAGDELSVYETPSEFVVHCELLVDGTKVDEYVTSSKILHRVCLNYSRGETAKLKIWSDDWFTNNYGIGFRFDRITWWVNEKYKTTGEKLIPKGTVVGQLYDSWGEFDDAESAVYLQREINADAGVTVPYFNGSKSNQTSAWGKAWFYNKIWQNHPSMMITDFGINDINSTGTTGFPATIEGPDGLEYDNLISQEEYIVNMGTIKKEAMSNNITPVFVGVGLAYYQSFPNAFIDANAVQT